MSAQKAEELPQDKQERKNDDSTKIQVNQQKLRNNSLPADQTQDQMRPPTVRAHKKIKKAASKITVPPVVGICQNRPEQIKTLKIKYLK